ncbi:L,D-transpeptidase family protein [Lacimicrobium sp. SS2-24]|uniref:L,D-transpeptidase family protein n=1 Tax=Lacimicrobium sp. SS2-24 TaxID=2005569 RepID=UPI000B4B830E|nr:L,D-transpeptidase family protein [Lacimicrobium sp. SS2-24]
MSKGGKLLKKNGLLRNFRALLGITLAGLAAARCWAVSYDLPGVDSDLIGKNIEVVVQKGQTLADIADQYSLGFNELVLANPGVDPWLPKPGSQILLPMQRILPDIRHGVVINLAEFRLYYFPPKQSKVITYPVGIGRQGWETPVTQTRVTGKNKDPWWRVPESVRAEHRKQGRELPELVRPGKDNPLGGYAINLDLPGYLLHGTNKAFGVGTRISHGCIRLRNDDIANLYQQLPEGTPVTIIDQPVKTGWHKEKLMLQVYPPLATPQWNNLTPVTSAVVKASQSHDNVKIDWKILLTTAKKQQGLVQQVSDN